MAASLIDAGVSKSGRPISKCRILRPAFSSCVARSSTRRMSENGIESIRRAPRTALVCCVISSSPKAPRAAGRRQDRGEPISIPALGLECEEDCHPALAALQLKYQRAVPKCGVPALVWHVATLIQMYRVDAPRGLEAELP